MAFTLNTKSYSKDSTLSQDAIRYTGPANNFQAVDAIDLKRTAPKPTKDSNGVARGQLKVTRTSVTNATLGTRSKNSINIESNIAVGTPEADVDALLADAATLLSSATGKQVIFAQKVEF